MTAQRPRLTVAELETATFRVAANGRVYRKGDRSYIGWTEWTLDGDYPAGGWYGFRRDDTQHENWSARSKPLATQKEAGRWVAQSTLTQLRFDWQDYEREHAWETLDRDAWRGRLEAEAQRIIRANCRGKLHPNLSHLTRGRLDLSINFWRKADVSGFARGRNYVSVTVGPRTPWWQAQWLLTHELAHLVPGTDPRGTGRKRVVHGPKWQAAFARITEKAHGIDVWAGVDDKVIWSRSRGVDALLIAALKEQS